MKKNIHTLVAPALSVSAAIWLAACSPQQSAAPQAADDTHMEAAPIKVSDYTHFENVGRDATANEVAAWNIDVRPDFQGLPEGSGTAEDGEELWVDKCAVCHGDFGDSNEVFFPLIGNTTQEDIETGRVAALLDPGKVRTTIMKVPYVSTLWDFIYRAMPWNDPKSLTPDETYALVAYMLNLAEIVEYDEEVSHATMPAIQERMPNRNGTTTDHGMWTVDGEPDTHNTDCMSDCKTDVDITSELPEYAYDAHGDLLPQFRQFGPVRGWDLGMSSEGESESEAVAALVPTDILSNNGCLSCHGMDHAVVGPALQDVANKYGADDAEYLTNKIYEGGSGVWGSMPMPPQPNLKEADAKAIVDWLTK